MADPTVPKKHWWWLLTDAVVSFATAYGLDLLVKDFVKKMFQSGAEKLGDKAVNKVLEDKRAELLEDLRRLGEEDKKNIANLERRLKVARSQLKEGRLVDLLCKICVDPTDGRRKTLAWLNNMSDARFNTYLYLLENDRVLQWIQRLWQTISRVFGKVSGDTTKTAKSLGEQTIIRLRLTIRWLKRNTKITGDKAEQFLAWCTRPGGFNLLRLLLLVVFVLFAIAIAKRLRQWKTKTAPFRSGVGDIFLVIGLWIALCIAGILPVPHDITLIFVLIAGIILAKSNIWERREVEFLRPWLICGLILVGLILIFGGRNTLLTKAEAAEDSVATRWNDYRAQSAKEKADRQRELAAQRVQARAEAEAEARAKAQQQPIRPPAPIVREIMIAGVIAGVNAAQKQTVEEARTIVPPAITLPPSPAPLPAVPVTPPTPVKPCRTVNDAGAPTFQYGEVKITIAECHREGTQEVFAGSIEYSGPERKLLAFHRFIPSDTAGNKYTVQEGRIGRYDAFGMGYRYQWMEIGVPTPDVVAFSFVVGSIDPSSSAPLNLTLPWNQSGEGVNFKELIEAQ